MECSHEITTRTFCLQCIQRNVTELLHRKSRWRESAAYRKYLAENFADPLHKMIYHTYTPIGGYHHLPKDRDGNLSYDILRTLIRDAQKLDSLFYSTGVDDFIVKKAIRRVFIIKKPFDITRFNLVFAEAIYDRLAYLVRTNKHLKSSQRDEYGMLYFKTNEPKVLLGILHCQIYRKYPHWSSHNGPSSDIDLLLNHAKQKIQKNRAQQQYRYQKSVRKLQQMIAEGTHASIGKMQVA